MNPVNAKDQQGLPVLYIKNIPPQSSLSIKVEPACHLLRRGTGQLRAGQGAHAGV